ncbi:LLM class flavin-dependent oxidoreductase [Candidatus Poriferisodalis sp.]|uniref:LLM class flavin-dependent oxidoreductase n=1 Tax=Candidatus Poriferisodalis sp. TaxID=3101277 RepID=UPI003C6EA5F5
MRTAIGFGGPASGKRRDWDEQVEFLREAERLGVDILWSAEAWGMDGVSTLAYLAAVTERVKLGTGILQISARAPAMTAMTALSMAAMTGDRFILGLGVSGPQVVEGLHGVPFADPLGRLRETVDICRQAFAGERISHEGRHHVLPLPGGQGKSLRLSQPANDTIEIWLATLGPKSLRYTGEAADGWVGVCFVPSCPEVTWGQVLEGAAAAGRAPGSVACQAGGAVEFGDDLEALIEPRRPGVAFTLGAMGSATANFYNDAYRRAGFEEECREVQRLWLDGDRAAATAAVPDRLITETNFLGTHEQVTDQVRGYRDAGVDVLRLQPEGPTAIDRLDTLAQMIDIVRNVSAEPASTGPVGTGPANTSS